MATYNGAQFIAQQISSILKQLGDHDELVISDDSSIDETVTIINSFADHRIKLYTGQRFRNPILNFQFALNRSSGKYIFLADQDDVWMDDKYEIMIAKLTEYDLVISDSIIVDQQLNPLHPSFFEYFGSRKGLFKNMIKSSYYGSCMAFNRKVLEAALPFPDTKEIGHDLWLGLVAEIKFSVLFLKKPLLKYRRHEQAFTPVIVGKSKRTILQMVYGRIIMIKEVTRFIFNKRKLAD